jgi:hypothetical protein
MKSVEKLNFKINIKKVKIGTHGLFCLTQDNKLIHFGNPNDSIEGKIKILKNVLKELKNRKRKFEEISLALYNSGRVIVK